MADLMILLYRVVFNEVVKTNKEYMQDITVIEADWLYTLASHYYQFGTVCVSTIYPFVSTDTLYQ